MTTLLISTNSAFNRSLSQSFNLHELLDCILAGLHALTVSFYVEMYLLLAFISKGSQITLCTNIVGEI